MAFEPIAVVGRACVLPGALTPEALWDAVSTGRDLLGSAPEGRWGVGPADILCEHDDGGARNWIDRTWTDRGGYVTGFEDVFDPEGFGIPADEVRSLDPLFQWVFHTAREALRDAGADHGPDASADHGRTGAVFGNLSFPSTAMARFAEATWIAASPGYGDADIAGAGVVDPDPRNRFMSSLPALLLARALGLGAGAYALDAACASSLYAIKQACDRLHDRRADLMLAGAVNRADDLFIHVGFCALSAMSGSGVSRPFHRDADGLVPAEGAGFVVLKRLSDAVRDGDTVHGVIRGVGLSNDGRGRGILAPSDEGQARAIRAAYETSGLSPSDVSLLECHATGTQVGDATEIASTARVFAGLSGVPVGSLKSNLGHLVTAAGIAGVIKVLEAMRAGVRPPTLHADEPAPGFAGSPFRLLTAAEPWDCDGPRRAGVSAFGFGGNNAHLILEEFCADEAPPGTPPPAPAGPVAIVGLGAAVADGRSRAEFSGALLDGASATSTRAESVRLSLEGLRFPPNDLRQSLPQQLLVLAAAREAVEETRVLPRERTGVLIGMEADPEVARYGARWRLAEWARRWKADPEWLERARDAVVPHLESPGVVGAMPNVPANRLNGQFDLRGPSCVVSAGEGSGLVAMAVAARALRAGELDAAVVGAVDLSCEEAHERAAGAVLPQDRRRAGDAAVVLVLKRLDDARRDGDRIYAVLDDGVPGDGPLRMGLAPGATSLTERFGHAHAASGLVHLAAAALSLHHRALPDGRPWISTGQRYAAVEVESAEGQRIRWSLAECADAPATRETPPPRLHVFSGADASEVLGNLAAGRESDTGPARLVVVADGDEQFARRAVRARAHLESGAPPGDGVHFRSAPVTGEMAFVFTGAGAAYHGMGRGLLRALPELGDRLAERFPSLPYAMGWVFGDPARRPSVLDQLWGASALCQLHADLSRNVLALEPQAAIGYSSGESNSLFAFGVWADMEAMCRDARVSGLFDKKVGGRFDAVARVWGRRPTWALWTVLAPIERIREAVAREPYVHLAIIHSAADGVIAGDAEGCDRVVEAIGTSRCHRLHYDVVAHVPELDEVRGEWLKLHRRDVTPAPHVRFYSNANNGPYVPDRESCARAILAQARKTLDFPRTIERAWADGVRIFVEHGPQGACSRWIDATLDGRDAVVVHLDKKGRGVEQVFEAAAALVAAGVPVAHERLTERLTPRGAASVGGDGRTLEFPAHWAPVRIPPLPSREVPPPEEPAAAGSSFPRPPAPEPESRPRRAAPPAPAPVPPTPAATPAPTAAPSTTASTTASTVAAAPTAAAPHTAIAPASLAAVDARWRAHVAQLSRIHQDYLESQATAHQRFLALREQAARTLLLAPGEQGVAGVPSAPPASGIGVPLPTAPAPAAPPPPPPLPSAPAPTAPSPQEALPGLRLDRSQLEIHASGAISQIYGPLFEQQDGFARQVRMPEPPLLLADRVVGLDAEAGSMGVGTIWTETDVRDDSWYLNAGYMPAGVMIEAGQADLMLISYLGIDFANRGERVYRLLGCQLTYHANLPSPGETLRYDIHVDGHANQGDVRLFFFHYDCRVDGELRLSVREGQAGFFTEQELADSAGILWTPESQEVVADPRLDAPVVDCPARSFEPAAVRAFADGRPWECFGPGHDFARTHVRTPRVQDGRMLFLERIAELDPRGGPWRRGYLRAETPIREDDWFFPGHFKNDPCMPGTLMFEGCLQAMSFYMAALGFTLRHDGWRFQPVSGETFDLRCRGQATPESRELIYEIFVEEVVAGPIPTVYADLLCTIDGLKAFHARRVGLQLVPDWPITSRPEILRGHVEPKPVASANGFDFDYRSLLACAWGKPSHAFGEMYRPFDGHRRVARLPGPPYHFMSRVTRVHGDIGDCRPGAEIELEYDIPADAWYFDENGCRTMPFAVLLEAALQPCGWLASYVGSALTVDEDLSFRNLDGTATQLDELHGDAGTLRTAVKLTNISQTAGMIIESFDVTCYLGDRPVYEMQTVFGFFPLVALENQVGLPTAPEMRAVLEEPSDFLVDLTTRPERYCSSAPRLPTPMLLMLDRVTGYWPAGGAAGLGRLRAEKDVDPSEWFFKAHFFQDPVQPGSLGLEAMVQLLQFFMLETDMQSGMRAPRFEPLALDVALTWKYRGQVVPSNRLISTTLEITETGRDERGPYAVATASLWVDAKRIYEAGNLGMRIVEDDGPADSPSGSVGSVDAETLDPSADTWLRDHCPTWTLPALPMMSMVEHLAAAVPGRVIGLRDVRVRGWLVLDGPRRLRTERKGDAVTLFAEGEDGEREVAVARVLEGEYAPAPEPWPAIDGEPFDSPYESGRLFHGPAFQLLRSLVMGAGGSSAVLDARAGAVPVGRLHQALLDAATHGIPHDDLHRWTDEVPASEVAYPAVITEMDFHGPAPTTGEARAEVRFDGFMGGPRFPAFRVQIVHAGRVWCAFRLIEACFPKGSIGTAAPLDRRRFLRDRAFVAGLSLSRRTGGETRLCAAEVEQVDWLPGTVAELYGTRDVETIAVKEHLAAESGLHPGALPAALPLTRFSYTTRREGDDVVVSSTGASELDMSRVLGFWDTALATGSRASSDLYVALVERFVRRVVVADPAANERIRGRGALYVANHQVGVESLLFSVVASALSGLLTVTLAKVEHRETWLGRLVEHGFAYPGVDDLGLIRFFERSNTEGAMRAVAELGAEMRDQGRSTLVHVEGTRSLSCRRPVTRLTGAFIDMAMAMGAPIVPVRFVGGLPAEPLEQRLEFPLGMGRQDYWIGPPILPQELGELHYGARKAFVSDAINGLGPAHEIEEPGPPDPEFAAAVRAWEERSGVRHAEATLFETLRRARDPSDATRQVVAAVLSGEMPEGDDPESAWTAELVRRLRGTRP